MDKRGLKLWIMGGWIHTWSYPQIVHRQAAASSTAIKSLRRLIFNKKSSYKSYPQRQQPLLNFF
jgi:hypothetical protein